MFGFNLDMPKKKNLIMSLAFLTASLFVFVTQAAKDDFSVLDNYVFTDNPAKIKVQGKMKSIRYRVRTVTRSGWGPESEGEADVVDSLVEINPMTEGIHIVTFPGTVSPEVRFLAITPPVKLDQTRVEKILTQKGKKLFSNQSFRIVSMGDSVTHTGDYESMLVMLLESATGNKNISFVDRSYPGRSADATVREFQKDAVENRPDLGLVMYGLNDQACGVPLPTYLDQYAWLARQLRLQCGSDCIFMQPTPVFYISVFGIVNLDAYDPWSIFRTIGFAGALENLGACENVPVAKTFDAIWDKGGPTLQDSARAMWPLFPVHCRKQMTSMLETDGKGDPIHPNALGHLMFAKSIFNTIAGVGFGEEIIQFTGSSHWTDKGLISKISAVNRSGVRQEGMLKVYPQFFFGNANSPAALMRNNGTYSLNPGETFDIEIQWPEVKRPGDLLKYPYSIHTVRVEPFLPVVNYSGNKSSVHPVRVPFDLECRILPNRQVVKGNEVCYAVNCGGRNQVFSAEIPADSEVGLIPLVEKIANGGKTGWAVAEILYARYAAALKGEATVDGRLDEWGEHSWIPIGEQVQARARNGAIEDNRKSPDEFYLKWAFKAGEKGLYLAAKIKGTLLKDRFFVFFDPRTPENLGTVGRYYWLSGEVEQNKNKQNPTNGRLVLKNGETSPKACGKTLTACSFADNEGAIEILVPYELMETSAWPESNDLGISIVWAHYHGDQKITRMTWTETGHEWTPCNYGVVRLVEHGHPSTKLPYLAIIK